MVRPKIRQSPQKRAYSSKQLALQEEYKYERELYNRRVRSWIRTRHYFAEPLPTLEEALEAGWVIDRRLIRQMQRTRIENLTKSDIRTFEQNYTLAYDSGRLDNIMRPKKKMLEPPTEQDFYNEPEQPEQEQPQFQTEPVDSDQEIEADLANFIDGVLEEALASVRSDMMELATQRAAVFRSIYESAVYRVGNKKAFLTYLEESSTHFRIVEVVTAGIQDSMADENTYRYSLQEFAAILQANTPITIEQSETLDMYGVIQYDFTDTPFDND